MEVSNQYWAGLFDGEGCVTPNKYVSRIHNQKFIVAIRVSVTQKEPMVCYLLQKVFGGAIRTQKQTTMGGFKTHITRWECGKAEEVMNFLNAIKPYVIIKAVEIAVALELLDSIVKTRKNYDFKKVDGRSFLSGKMPIELDEIKRRQILEMKFYEDRKDSKDMVVDFKPKDS
jgi:hypothetical protein